LPRLFLDAASPVGYAVRHGSCRTIQLIPPRVVRIAVPSV